MFHTLTNVQSGSPLSLPQYIDNRDGLLRVGLRSITVTVGWYNVGDDEAILVYGRQPGFGFARVAPGLYGFDDLKALIEGGMYGTNVKVDLDKTSGRGILTVNAGAGSIRLWSGFAELLGLTRGYDGSGRPVPFPMDGPGAGRGHGGRGGVGEGYVTLGTGEFTLHPDLKLPRALNIHLEQINTSDNYVDGHPSTLLASVGISNGAYGDIEHAEFTHPCFKRLQDGTIHELKVVVCDDKGKPIDNHGKEISVELEIKKE